jgi:predicted 3-demethylubiquinone-9 3-methyltransferase (glyoxalase superfamily)
MQITPFLWFDSNAEEAVNFYTSVFKDSKIESINRYGEAGQGPKGTVMTIAFQLLGQDFVALNGGPEFTFTPAVSFVVDCKTQQEIDGLWDKLSEGGEKVQCGWLRDKFGVSWQIVPSNLSELFESDDPEKSERVMKAMLQMEKLDIKALQEA